MIPYDPKWPNYEKEKRVEVLALMKIHHPEKLYQYYKEHYARHRANNLARMKLFRSERPERVLAIRRKTMTKHRENLRVKALSYYQKNKMAVRVRTAERKFGLAKGGYAAMMEAQGHKCQICRIPQSELVRRFAVDHSHTTGKVRGLLCAGCNTGIGMLGDSPTSLRAAADYIERHSK